MKALTTFLSVIVFFGFCFIVDSKVTAENKSKAPKWEVDEWKNLPKGKKSLSIEDFKGKVVYLYCFQSWCPGCHKHGFPTLQKLIKHYRNDDKVAFVTIQTVFEGFHINTPENAWKVAKKYGLTIPVGHSGINGKRSKIMKAYKTGGTPWCIIIDPEGNIRFGDFHISSEKATEMIDRLKIKKETK